MQDTKPVLHNRDAFEEILKNYHVSDRAKDVLAATPFVALSGLAGGGRNTVINYLVEHDNYGFVISDTTRPPKVRNGQLEQDGVHYYFRDEQDLLEELKNGEFIEAELIHNQQVSGTSIREVERIVATGKIPIHDYEFGGCNAVADAKTDAAIIGLLPPNYDEWIRRLTGREVMSPEEFHNRLVTAEKVLENMLSKPYFKFVINDTVEKCAAAIDHIVKYPDQLQESDHARLIASELLERVKEMLAEDGSN